MNELGTFSIHLKSTGGNDWGETIISEHEVVVRVSWQNGGLVFQVGQPQAISERSYPTLELWDVNSDGLDVREEE